MTKKQIANAIHAKCAELQTLCRTADSRGLDVYICEDSGRFSLFAKSQWHVSATVSLRMPPAPKFAPPKTTVDQETTSGKTEKKRRRLPRSLLSPTRAETKK